MRSRNYVTQYGSIVYFCKELLVENENYRISFTRQQANFVAHTFARASKLYTRVSFSMGQL